MFSRIFESDRAATPPSHAGGKNPANMSPRPAGFEPALSADHLADVVGVALAEVGNDPLSDGVELGAEGLDLRRGSG